MTDDSINVLNIRYDDNEPYANDPNLVVVIDRDPKECMNFVYQAFEISPTQTVYVAQSGPFIDTHLHDSTNENGWGGHVFSLKMEDGTTKEIKGPWDAMPDLEMLVGINRVRVTGVVLKPEQYPEIWDELHEHLEKLQHANKPPTTLNDESRAGWYFELLSDDIRQARGRSMWRTYQDIRSRYYNAIYDTSESPWNTKSPRGWEGTEEQIEVVSLIASWFPPSNFGSSYDVEANWLLEQMEKHLPTHTLYRRRWNKDGLSQRTATPDVFVPAPKAATSDILGGDTPRPKNEGWWGYAIHDRYGHPKSGFYDTVEDLLKTDGHLLREAELGDLKVSSRCDACWSGLDRDKQALVDRVARGGSL